MRFREDLIHPDPLLDCLVEVCRLQGQAASRATLSAGMPLVAGRLTLELAERVAQNAPLTNFAVLQALPLIAEASPQTGLMLESLMASVAQSDQEAKNRIRDFLEKKVGKVKSG